MMYEQNGNINKDIEKNIIEMKILIELFKNRFEQSEEYKLEK